jgi:hypothetical protein
MAQTPQATETGGADGTTDSETGRPQGLFGSSTTILLLIFAVAVFWWSRRRRVEMEERLRAQRREAEATAERSALDVAHLMRAAPQPGAAAAASREGLASAAGLAAADDLEHFAGGKAEAPTSSGTGEPGLRQAFDSEAHDEEEARAIERAEARAAAERAAEEQAARASREAELAVNRQCGAMRPPRPPPRKQRLTRRTPSAPDCLRQFRRMPLPAMAPRCAHPTIRSKVTVSRGSTIDPDKAPMRRRSLNSASHLSRPRRRPVSGHLGPAGNECSRTRSEISWFPGLVGDGDWRFA